MPIVIRPLDYEGDRSLITELAGTEWDLEKQLKALEVWVLENQDKLPFSEPYVADVGYGQKKDPMAGGPCLTTEFMQACASADLNIFLSAYPPTEPDPDYVQPVYDAAFLQELKDARDRGPADGS